MIIIIKNNQHQTSEKRRKNITDNSRLKEELFAITKRSVSSLTQMSTTYQALSIYFLALHKTKTEKKETK